MNKHFLIVDGNYFAMRSLMSLNKGTEECTLESELDQERFRNNLISNLQAIIDTFQNKNILDQVIFVADTGSWRRELCNKRPFYFDALGFEADTPIGYKENRKEKKEESSINFEHFYRIYNEWFATLPGFNIPTFAISNAEGDDLLYLIGEKLPSNCQGYVFCTDGDLIQVVRPNYHLFRNIRSKAASNGEIVVLNENLKYLQASNQIVGVQQMFESVSEYQDSKQSFFDQLSVVCIGDRLGETKIDRTFGAGISVANGNHTAFVKSFCGDKKDNVFPIIRWKSASGSRVYGPTEKMLDKLAPKPLAHYLNDETDVRWLIGNFISSVFNKLDLTLQMEDRQTLINKCYEHFCHNRRIIQLSLDNIPTDIQQQFNREFEQLSDIIFESTYDYDKIAAAINQESNQIFEEALEDLF